MKPHTFAGILAAAPGICSAKNSPSQSASDTADAAAFCCSTLEAAGFGTRVEYPGAQVYEERIASYWSAAAQLRPWCLIQPRSTGEVSTLVSTLVAANKAQQCQFAVRAGGHLWWEGSNNIQNGVTIDLGLMNATTYHPENSTASVQPGARWDSFFDTLDKAGVSSVGGRTGNVGVGGLTLGGGISFFSAQKGMVCDNVVNFEVVLGSGEVVNANSKENPDLWHVLKGGGNNFGIVTRMDFVTFANPQQWWGGVVTYPIETIPQHTKAFVDFTSAIEDDPRASMIYGLLYTSQTDMSIVLNWYEYTDPTPRAPIFDGFMAIPGNLTDTMRISNHTDFANATNRPVGDRNFCLTTTFENDERVLAKAVALFNEAVDRVRSTYDKDWLFLNFFQPIPTAYTKQSVARGGNVLGLDRFDENLVLVMIYFGHRDPAYDDFFLAAAHGVLDEIDAFAKSVGKGNDWRYLDYAHSTQDPLGSAGAENVAKMRAAAAKFDPDGVFQTLMPGGFKISKVDVPAADKASTGKSEL